MMYKIIHNKVQVENGSYLIQTAGAMTNNFYSHTQELMLTSTLITPPQLDYGMAFPAVLSNHLTLTYLSYILILA